MKLLEKEFIEQPIEALNSLFLQGETLEKSLFVPLDSLDIPSEQDILIQSNKLNLDPFHFPIDKISKVCDTLLESKATLAHFLTLFKLVTLLKVKIMSELSIQIPKVSEEISYWNSKTSPLSVLWHTVESAPISVLNTKVPIISSMFGPKRVRFEDTWNARLGLNFSTKSFLNSITNWKRFNPIKVTRKRIKQNTVQLEKIRQIQAHALGFLSYPYYLDSFKSNSGLHAHVQILYDSNSLYPETKKSLIALENGLKTLIDRELTTLENVIYIATSFDTEFKTEFTESFSDAHTFITQSIVRINQTKMALETVSKTFQKHFNQLKRPSFLFRNWVYVGAFVAGGIKCYNLYTLKGFVDGIFNCAKYSVETISLFLSQWIVRPVEDIISTIRLKEARLAILGRNSLAADLDSLERMVLDYAKDHTPEIDPTLISEQVRTGDIGAVLQEYEKDLQHPGNLFFKKVRSLIAGSLVRSLLIQVQKVKVDGALAMSALDKLLRSNELNFAFLALVPTILITFGLVSWFKGIIQHRKGMGYSSQMAKIRHCVR
jgi:hypothetical protein